MRFDPPEDIRRQVIESTISIFEQRFYDPALHGFALRRYVNENLQDLLRTTAFSHELTKFLASVKAFPIEFFHASERQFALWKTIQATLHPWNGRWMFQDVLTGGLADGAGVQPGAILVAINGREINVPEAPRFSRSPAVTITFENPGDRPQSFSFDAEPAVQKTYTNRVKHKLLRQGVGYIRISKFPGLLGIDVARELDGAVRDLRKPGVLIIDMRGNLGSEGAGNLRLMSYLTPAKIPVGYSLTRARAAQGYHREELVQFTKIPRYKLLAPFSLLKFKNVDKSIVVVTEGLGKQSFHGRIIMLVNEHTVSGGEIVAGFASDHKLAIVMGANTSGRLLSWTTIPIGYDCFLTLPTGNYLTWEGKSFEGTGVTPDHSVPFSPEAARSKIDAQLDTALEMALHL